MVLQQNPARPASVNAGWMALVGQTFKRRKPCFSEFYYGFRSFGQRLEEAQARGILELEREEKSGSYIIRRCHAG